MIDKDFLRQQKPTFLQLAGNGKSYICPACGSGSGKKGSGITQNPNNPTQYKCWACGLQGDVIDLYGAHTGITGTGEIFKACAEYYGTGTTQSTQEQPRIEKDAEEEQDHFSFLQVANGQNDGMYLRRRGIPLSVQKHFFVGYDPEWVNPQAVQTVLKKGGNPDNLPRSPRCIIPRNKRSYLARDIRVDLTEEQEKYAKQNVGKVGLFNPKALESDVVFIVEGEIDAMSVYSAGGNACGLCSTSNVKALLKRLEGLPGNQRFICMLDNDEAGKKATKELVEGLERLGKGHIVAKYSYKDPNAFLLSDEEGMKKLISSLQVEVLQCQQGKKDSGEYRIADCLGYFENIEKQPAGFEVKTGFRSLDAEERNLYGGLHEGLYIIGAVSSLGKTTFCLQMADQIAENGQDVLFFSLEQSHLELMAKSISRHTYLNVGDKKGSKGHFLARDTNQILNNRRYKYYTSDEKQVIADAIQSYREQVKDHLSVFEGRYKGERLTVLSIREIVKEHVRITGRIPVIFVDYLQILGTPADFRGNDKQATDIAVAELKDLSRTYKTAVFAISSFNRENYKTAVSMASFKESGAIEYGSDVLLGLQYAGMGRLPGESEKKYEERMVELRESNEEKKRVKEPVEIELKCLKNRNGNLFTVPFDLINAFNCYQEIYINDNGFRKSGRTPFDAPAKIV